MMNKKPQPIKPQKVFDDKDELNLGSKEEKVTLDAAREFEKQDFIDLDYDNEIVEDVSASLIEPSKSKPGSKLTRLTLFSLFALVVIQTVLALISSWHTSPWLFAFYTSITTLVLLWTSRLVWKEAKRLKLLKSTANIQAQGERLRLSMQQGEANKFIQGLIERLNDNANLKDTIDQYHQLIKEAHNDAESLSIFDDVVLSCCDKKAQQIVTQYSVESALMLAASPLAVLDMALILWRNQKMLREIAGCYGIELGYWSRIKLIRAIVHNVIYAGATEVAIDLGSQLLSMEMASKISARLAQGMGGGLLTARLGYQAMALCRPLSFSNNTKPKLSHVYKTLLVELKSLAFKAKAAVKSKN